MSISTVVLFVAAILLVALHALVLCLVLVLMETVRHWWLAPHARFWTTYLSMFRAAMTGRDVNSPA